MHTTLHTFGLGSHSTYLNTLSRAGRISDRIWIIFWGRRWIDVCATGGLVVLGCYDKDKVIGRNFTQPLDGSEETGCWTGMKVTVANLFVNFRNATNSSIVPRNSAIQICIVPRTQLLLEALGAIVNAFKSATRMKSTGPSSAGTGRRNCSIRTRSSSTGDLTFILSNSLQIRIPKNQFLSHFMDVDWNESRIIDKTKR